MVTNINNDNYFYKESCSRKSYISVVIKIWQTQNQQNYTRIDIFLSKIVFTQPRTKCTSYTSYHKKDTLN